MGNVNRAPVAKNDTYTIRRSRTITVSSTGSAQGVLTNDTDPEGQTLSAVLVKRPFYGTLTLNPDGSFTYTPKAYYIGTDRFTYRATDGTATSNVATVQLRIRR